MTTHWNPAHADEEPEAAGNHETGRPSQGEAPGSGQEARSGEQAWNGYVVPENDRANAGWAPPAGDAWPPSRPVGPPPSSYPALRRAVDQQSGDAPYDPEQRGGADAAGDDAPTAPVPQVGTEQEQPADRGRGPLHAGAGDGDEAAGADEESESGESAPLPKRPVRDSAESGPRQARREQGAPAAAESQGPERPSHGRHAAARAEPEAPRRESAGDAGGRGDPDDPDRLADWVGSLADVNESNMIAGRRTGPMPVVGAHGAPAGQAESAEPEPQAERPQGRGTVGTRYWADDTYGDDEEFRPTAGEDLWEPMPEVTREQLITRLDAVSALVGIGADDFDSELIEHAQYMLDHAGARLRLSGEHTVVALAGGTGSGKSSLFNALCGLDFSRVGITRPTTSDVHACVWGNEGAEGLLNWLGVPRRSRHSRTSELDKTSSELSGLILLDLPDHDSVRAEHTAEAARLIGSCDLLVWVLDPQKYADAAVHHRYLAEMTGHGSVTVAVLNQVDRVEREELEELLTDLRRLLETESGVHPRILTTSTLTGQGIRGLRSLLAETVSARRAQIDRLVADLDRVVVGFERYHGDPDEIGTAVPDRVRSGLVDDLVDAGGVAAIADSAETAYQREGERRVGWPIGRWARKLRRDPLRSVGDGFSGETERAAPVEAYGAGIDKAAVDVAGHVAGSLPVPWPRRVRAAARSGLDTLPDELSGAVSASVPDPDDTPTWWRAVQALQYLLVALAGAGVLWFLTVLVSWLAGGLTGVPVLDTPLFLGFAAAVAVATPVAGWLTGTGCANLIEASAAQRREQVEQRSSQRARELAEERILAPVEQEMTRYAESCRALATAKGATVG
ncbi:GTPase [Streptomonospora litoralis]|uniref:tRNA modification GTPase TrmE n=1 Tax=Streptomonospora litoralis TaxID=2498135 RepID=A0A4P6Q3W6_9ACTN|nr:GTPase [Streptomonospora litoralis]QBI55388.1 tRNA modification GTPase TrmE [Streptomonospora litoralis]